ncbi:hypothetical protein CN535_27405 [Bacillus pseudomycoides]|nr:hypothetical protein BLX05_26010 [Bacillus pseudomycoides]PDY08928.1 hypothetical protein COO16_28195 [Bacillus pseudomycoides]PEU32985.1 hypothetical protein CN535_27405 [Bacillus pseudomycoides]PFY06823.1 hypothetical protein COL42_28785 [Bacillus pseudomycoides]PGA66596.1 hypothetical protein COL89_26050 [Bacillus pseudomycoides]
MNIKFSSQIVGYQKKARKILIFNSGIEKGYVYDYIFGQSDSHYFLFKWGNLLITIREKYNIKD